MSRNLSDSKQERDLLNRIARLEQLVREKGTTQVQGGDALQINYTTDNVFPITLAPASGLIGTFLCVLEYDDPRPESVVYGDLDIAVNKGTDSFANNLSAYYGGLHAEVINDLFLEQAFFDVLGYHPVVKVVRLTTTPSMSSDTFYIHTRWRYVGVGKTLVQATGDISIIPTGP
jgi:hypothetical protein